MNDGGGVIGFRSQKLDADEQQRLREIADAQHLEVVAPIELERVEGSDRLLVFVPDGSLWLQGSRADVEFRGRDRTRVTFEGDPPTARYLVGYALASLFLPMLFVLVLLGYLWWTGIVATTFVIVVLGLFLWGHAWWRGRRDGDVVAFTETWKKDWRGVF
jgi:hypothetical protein